MGTVKDLVDLLTQLANSVEDRKLAAELGKIQSQILGIQAEQSSLHDANISLREERLDLKERILELENQIKEFSNPIPAPAGIPRCPNCSSMGKPFYMSPLGGQESRILGATHQCPKCKYRARGGA